MKHAKIFTELANRIDPNISMLDAAMDMIAKLRAVSEGLPDDNLKQTPLTEEQIKECLFRSRCYNTVKMSIDIGPYAITRPTQEAESFVRAIEKLHGIGVDA